jgi:hypothetical protein
MPRFVILRHEMPAGSSRASHWDLMFERGSALRTWAVESDPGTGPQRALLLPDHRLDYLEYEGPVSGERGTVTRWDRGEYAVEAESPDALSVTVRGVRLVGRMTFRHSAVDHSWRVSFEAAPTSGAGDSP